jgi:hypothetical protein
MMKRSRADYEQRLLDEIQDFSESDLPKILKLIHFLKKEIFENQKQKEEDLRLFWETFGSWKDDRRPEEIIKEIYASRKSTDRDIQL